MEKKDEFVLLVKESLLGMDKDLKEIEFSSISLGRIYLKLVKTHLLYVDVVEEEKGKKLRDLIKLLKFDKERFVDIVRDSYRLWDKVNIENRMDVTLIGYKEAMLEIINLILVQYNELNSNLIPEGLKTTLRKIEKIGIKEESK